MTPFTIYLWQIADSVEQSFGMLAVTAIIVSCILWAIFLVEKMGHLQKPAVIALSVGLTSWALAVLIPSSKTIAMMVAIPAIANSEPIQKDLPELYQLAKEALKEQIVGGKKTETK